MVIAARGAVRLFFIFAPITAVMASYSCIELGYMISKIKKKAYLYLAAAVLIIILVSPLAYPFKGIIPAFGESSLNMGRYSGPSYNQQWQIAGTWARENTPEDAIFGHWWDYGYWVQNGFERASVLDGANKIKYWNYLMGRHVLTAQSQEEALEFLYVHETTHYLIISDEIGKYTAYSSIGSNEDYDRYSNGKTYRTPTNSDDIPEYTDLITEGQVNNFRNRKNMKTMAYCYDNALAILAFLARGTNEDLIRALQL